MKKILKNANLYGDTVDIVIEDGLFTLIGKTDEDGEDVQVEYYSTITNTWRPNSSFTVSAPAMPDCSRPFCC